MAVAALETVYQVRKSQKPRWIEVAGWTATAIAVTGVVLNNHLCWACFPLWLLSNSLTAIIHVRSRLWALTARDLIFLGLAVDGWIRWTR